MLWTSQIVMDAVKTLVCPRGCVKHTAIIKHTGLSGKQVANACAKLETHGYLVREKFSDDSVKPGCYKLTPLGHVALEEGAKLTSGPKRATGKPKIRDDSDRGRAWRTLRIRRKISVPELLGLLFDAGTDDVTLRRAANNLQKYLRCLARAGYLAEMRREAPQSLTSNGAKRYLLVRDTGPLPPVPQKLINKILDQNESKQYDYIN
jgi:predicted transcriptional regulator